MGRLKMNTNHPNSFSITADSTPFTIAEAGLNHNGEIKKALEMIKIAKKAGVDAIKFQTFKANEIVVDESLTFTYKSQGKMITESQMELFKRCELDRNDFFEIKKICDEEKILFLSTPQNASDLELLLEIGITAIKIGSDDFTNIPLLQTYSKTGLPLIMSCGMANLDEIKQTMKYVSDTNDNQITLMLTTSQYPTTFENVNLLKLKTLSENFPEVILGYSDHTQGVLASSLAVAFGAKVFEKHFTLDKNLPGPDQWFAEDENGLKLWSDSIKTSHKLLGSSEVKPTEYENTMKILARRSIVALTDIENDEIFDEQNIGFRRPGNGLPPIMIKNIKGKKSSRKILKGELVMEGDFL
jgi:N,N'-diacetyllegionaminate synthase